MRLRRQKTLHEVALFLQSKDISVSGSSGLDMLCNALANFLRRPAPHDRHAKWVFLAEFIGKPAAYDASYAAKVERGAIKAAAKRTKGASAEFYDSKEWMALRYQVLKERGAKCECCGATRADGVVIQVDHVRPRSLFPELALEKSNMQVLCRPCNLGKSNRDDTDWRDGQTLQ